MARATALTALAVGAGLVALGMQGRKKPAGGGAFIGAQGSPAAVQRAVRAVESGDPKAMRAEAKKLRSAGEKQLAEGLERAATMLERVRAEPARTLPATVDTVLDPELMDPAMPTADDLLVSRWLCDEKKGAPPFLQADLYPDREKRRPLTPHERWVLGPYFGEPSDLYRPLLIFEAPPGFDQAQTEGNIWAVAMALPSGEPCVYFPNGPQSLLNRWWLAALAHELAHVSQFRMGGQNTQSIESMIRYGYRLSPLEVQARWLQRLVYHDLLKRARAFYGVK